MIKKWEIRLAPSRSDPKRRQLLFNGLSSDVRQILKKIGGLCSRPEKASAPYTFSMYLIKSQPELLKKVEDILSKISVSSPDTVKGTKEATEVKRAREAKEAAEVKKAAKTPEAKKTAETKEAAEAKKAVKTPEAKKALEEARKSREAIMKMRDFYDSDGKEEETAQTETRIKQRWVLEMPLIPTCSFETLVVGPHNRFAHAASMAVVENPGTMYNPLLLFGNPGTGKTHFIHSIGYGLSSSLGQDNLLISDGVRLSKGVQCAVKDGNAAGIEALFDKVKALIVDDVHLMALNEDNQACFSKWFNTFINQGKQIVLTSLYPPKALVGLENSLGFKLSQGWMVDIKVPSSQSYRVILNQMIQGMDVALSEDETASIFCRDLMPLGEVAQNLRNMRRLEKIIPKQEPPLIHAVLLDMLLGFSEVVSEPILSHDDSQKARNWQAPKSGVWGRWGMFYPKGAEDEAKWVLYSLDQRIRELEIKGSWEHVFTNEYDPDELYGIPPKIGDYANSRNITGVILLGPHPSSGLGGQEQEFRQIVIKILESMLIKCGWLGHSQIKSPSAYVRILLDILG